MGCTCSSPMGPVMVGRDIPTSPQPSTAQKLPRTRRQFRGVDDLCDGSASNLPTAEPSIHSLTTRLTRQRSSSCRNPLNPSSPLMTITSVNNHSTVAHIALHSNTSHSLKEWLDCERCEVQLRQASASASNQCHSVPNTSFERPIPLSPIEEKKMLGDEDDDSVAPFEALGSHVQSLDFVLPMLLRHDESLDFRTGESKSFEAQSPQVNHMSLPNPVSHIR